MAIRIGRWSSFNAPFEDATAAMRSSTLAEVTLVLRGDYVRRSADGLDFLVPVELADSYLSILEVASPGLIAP